MRRNITGPGPRARAADLWGFAVALYARPGVAEACLALQDRHGADIPLLLAIVWHAERGRGAPDLRRWRAVSAAWRDAAVLKLRGLRRALKGRAEWEKLRTRIKRLELAAERAQLAELARHARPRIDAPADPRAVLRSVLGNAARGARTRKILAEAAKMRSRSTDSRAASTRR
ncbi:MAG: TIGR02444 family protein [Tagaea sp.]|nr:TIGR02444 family protein [Tagaea sp.]